jgi:hypothetical protein
MQQNPSDYCKAQLYSQNVFRAFSYDSCRLLRKTTTERCSMEKHNSSPTALPSRNTESGAHLKQELIDTSRSRTHSPTHMARQTSIPSWCNRLCLTPILHLPAKLVGEYPPPHPLVFDPSRSTAVSFRRLFGSDLQFMQKVNEVSFAQSLDWHIMPLAPSLLAVLLLTLH